MSDEGPVEPGAPAPPGADAPRPARSAARKKVARPASGRPASGGGERTPKTPPPIDESAATMRGFVVIGVTVLVGLIIFARGISQTTDPSVDASGAPTTLPPYSSTSLDREAAPPTTNESQGTTIPVTPSTKVAPKDTKVLVANGVDPKQVIAGPLADKLTAAGYTVTNKVDLQTTAKASNVYYTEGMQAEAQGVAKALGWPDAAVAAMPTPPPTPLNGAQILVVAGTDRS